jgi:hypothetical protein
MKDEKICDKKDYMSIYVDFIFLQKYGFNVNEDGIGYVVEKEKQNDGGTGTVGVVMDQTINQNVKQGEENVILSVCNECHKPLSINPLGTERFYFVNAEAMNFNAHPEQVYCKDCLWKIVKEYLKNKGAN